MAAQSRLTQDASQFVDNFRQVSLRRSTSRCTIPFYSAELPVTPAARGSEHSGKKNVKRSRIEILKPRIVTLDTRTAKPMPKVVDDHYNTPEHRAWAL
jgi:hypothetical protein